MFHRLPRFIDRCSAIKCHCCIQRQTTFAGLAGNRGKTLAQFNIASTRLDLGDTRLDLGCLSWFPCSVSQTQRCRLFRHLPRLRFDANGEGDQPRFRRVQTGRTGRPRQWPGGWRRSRSDGTAAPIIPAPPASHPAAICRRRSGRAAGLPTACLAHYHAWPPIMPPGPAAGRRIAVRSASASAPCSSPLAADTAGGRRELGRWRVRAVRSPRGAPPTRLRSLAASPTSTRGRPAFHAR